MRTGKPSSQSGDCSHRNLYHKAGTVELVSKAGTLIIELFVLGRRLSDQGTENLRPRAEPFDSAQDRDCSRPE